MNEKYQLIRDLFGCYFHQDWNLYEESWRVILAEALLDSSENGLRELGSEINKLLLDNSDEELEEMRFPVFGCNYLPFDDGMNTRQWLAEVVEIIEQTLRQRATDGIGDFSPAYLKHLKQLEQNRKS